MNARAIQRAQRITYVYLAWVTVAAVVSIGAGLTAGFGGLTSGFPVWADFVFGYGVAMAPSVWWMAPMFFAARGLARTDRWGAVARTWLVVAHFVCAFGQLGEGYTFAAWDAGRTFHLLLIAGNVALPLVGLPLAMIAFASSLQPARGVRRGLRFAAAGGVAFAWLLVAGWSLAAGRTTEWEYRTWDLATRAIAIPDDDAARARGEHLGRSVAGCTECHGDDLGGKTSQDIPLVVTIHGPNLTRGQGGVTSSFTDADWLRVLRRGVRPDGRTLRIMPLDGLAKLSDDDLGALIAWLKTLPPVDRTMPAPVIGPVGQIVWATGVAQLGTAYEAAHAPPPPPPMRSERSERYGAYLVAVGGCTGCHGAELKGGPIPGAPSSVPPATDLTSTGPVASWSEAQFLTTMRTGKDPTGHAIDGMMPWRNLGALTDDELGAVWLALRSGVPTRVASHAN